MKINPVKLTAIAALSTIGAMSHAENIDTAIIDTTNISEVGFTLLGNDASLSNNTVQFPNTGHYCLVKNLKGDFKAGESIAVKLDDEEAAKNQMSLRVLTWGEGKYKGFGGRSGIAELKADLEFDTNTVSVGFCRYNNRSFDQFEISNFKVVHTIDVPTLAASAVEEPADDLMSPPVYPSCREYEFDDSAEVLVVDDSEPRTLQEMFNDGTIVPGMVVVLRRHEGDLFLNYKNTAFRDSEAPWLTILGENGASIRDINISAVKNIRFAGLNIGNDQNSYFVVNTYNTENIIFDHNFISAGGEHETWTAKKWQEIGGGITFNRVKCSTAYKNDLKNLRMGITTYAYDAEMRQEKQSLKVLIKKNMIRNISADHMRPIGSDIIVDGNVGLDSYVSVEDGDSNHDDFIQGFAYPIGTEFENVVITNNFYQASTDPERAFQSAGQGIVVFDGFYKDFEISNNTLISDMYHGITIFGGRNGLIKNNTVTSHDDNSYRYMWIQTANDKSGKYAPENIKVENNIANRMAVHSNNSKDATGNTEISRVEIATNFKEFDATKMKFDVAVKEDSYYYHEGVGSSITTLDQALNNLYK